MGTPALAVPTGTEASASPVRSQLNSKSLLLERLRTGALGWTGPLLVLLGRSLFMIAAQAIVASLLWMQSRTWSWNAAAKWWTVYGTLVDLGCLTLMRAYIGKEGIRLRDLIGPVHLRWGRDLFLGIACLCVIFPVFAMAFPTTSRLVYGSPQPDLYPGLLSGRSLPLWGVIYSLSLFWMVWSPTEEMTYNGYALPRLEVLCKRRWLALGIVVFWWALQHSFIPFILDWKYVAYRFLAFLPGVLVFALLYLRLRRLPPLIVAHWSMDISAIIYTLRF
ncbi:MAG TPA: CPBP family glutamic-type intramembrane protease [Dongiaceae bacterium]|nr:CPBP family glutamic-type intramembrane protease [Dongiaceae bacterium]